MKKKMRKKREGIQAFVKKMYTVYKTGILYTYIYFSKQNNPFVYKNRGFHAKY